MSDESSPEKVVAPAARANGLALRELICRWKGHRAIDEAFARDVDDARKVASGDSDDDPWRA